MKGKVITRYKKHECSQKLYSEKNMTLNAYTRKNNAYN